jgi:acetyl esterase
VPAAIVYFHGGGWVVGSPLSHIAITHALSDATGLALFSVDYRLLPGHAAAAPVRDGLAVARGLLAGAPSCRLMLAGDSAGAAIALAVAHGLETRHRGRLLGVVAFYAGCGLTRSPAIAAHGRREEGLDTASLEAIYARLMESGGAHPFTVAQLSRRSLPPVALFAGDRDPLLTDSRMLHAALQAMGVATALRIVAGAGHSFLHDVGTCESSGETIRQAAKVVAFWSQAKPPDHRRIRFAASVRPVPRRLT